MANLSAIGDLMHVDVNINFDESNVEQVPVLLDHLTETHIASKIGKLVFTPITPTPKDREGLRPATEMDCAWMTVETARQLIRAAAARHGEGLQRRRWSPGARL